MSTTEWTETALLLGGYAHFCILLASALVPFQLNWRRDLACLSRLHRQMYWTYAGYVVLAIVAFGVITVTNAGRLASGDPLARAFCGYVAVFWGVRVCLQPVFDAKPFLTAWWLKAGYHSLTVLFLALTAVYAWAALRPVAG